MARITRKQRVLNALRLADAFGQPWVAGHVIASPTVGGSEGLRRLRELRADGHRIEMRTRGRTATREYRLLEERVL